MRWEKKRKGKVAPTELKPMYMAQWCEAKAFSPAIGYKKIIGEAWCLCGLMAPCMVRVAKALYHVGSSPTGATFPFLFFPHLITFKNLLQHTS